MNQFPKSIARVSACLVLASSCARNAEPPRGKPIAAAPPISSVVVTGRSCNLTEFTTLLRKGRFYAAAQALRLTTSECAREALADKQQQVALGAGLFNAGGCHRLRELGVKSGIDSFAVMASQCVQEHSDSCNGDNRSAVDEALRQARVFEGAKQWDSASERVEAAERFCPNAAEALLEKAILADEKAANAAELWQAAAMALERQTNAAPTVLLDDSSLYASVRFAFDERETLAYPEELGCAVVIDRSTARPLKVLRWLTQNPSVIDRARDVVITAKDESYTVSSTRGENQTEYSFKNNDMSHRKDDWTHLTAVDRSRLVWLPEPKGMFIDPLNGNSYDPRLQRGLDELFNGSPIETVSVSPSGYRWILYKKPPPGEITTDYNAYKDIVQAWDARYAKKLREYPGRAGDGIALSESEVVLYDFDKGCSVLWNIETGKSEPVAPNREYTFESDRVLSDGRTVLLRKFRKGRLPGASASTTLWTLGIGLRRYETSDDILDVSTDGKWAIGGRNLLTHLRHTNDARPPASDFHNVVSLDTGDALSSVEVAHVEIRDVKRSPNGSALAIQTESGTSLWSLETGGHKMLPYPNGWSVTWVSDSSVAFVNHGKRVVELVDLANEHAVRRIDEVAPSDLGRRSQFNAVGNINKIFSVTETTLVATNLVTGQIEQQSCGNRCRMLAVRSAAQDVLVTWEEADRKGFAIAVFDANNLKLRVRATVPYSTHNYKLTNSMLPASDARGISPDGRWVPLVLGQWLGIWDLKASGASSLRMFRVEGETPVIPIGATDGSLYISLGPKRLAKLEWGTGRLSELGSAELEHFGKQVMLRSGAKGRRIHVTYRDGTVLGDIYFDRDGVPNITKDPAGRIDFLGSPPRHQPTCLYGDLLAPFAACAEVVQHKGFATSLIQTVRTAEAGDTWAN